MDKKFNAYITVAVLIIAIIAISGVFFPNSTPVQEVKQVLGVGAGPEHTEKQYFKQSIVDGSGIFATSTTGTFPVGALRDNKGVYITATGAGQATLSLTLPASTTMAAILPDKGSCASWFIDASDVAAATTTTIVAGTGWDLVGLDATGAGTGADVIDGAEFGKLTACKQTDGDYIGYVEEWLAAD